MTDGLPVPSETRQALRLFQEKDRARVTCMSIDPPYHPGSDACWDRTHDQHSRWLVMMENRRNVSRGLLRQRGFTVVTMDDTKTMNATFFVIA
jgi:adenine specific DNA methylase Mod